MSNLRWFANSGLSMYFWIMKVCERIAGLFNPVGATKGVESALDGAWAVAEASAAGCGS